MNYLPLVISVVSLLISLIQFGISIYSKRFTIKISPIGFSKTESHLYKSLYLKLLIENNSNLPISITNIKAFTTDKSLFNCSLNQHFVGETFMNFDGNESNKISYYTNNFPINILPYGATMAYIIFRVPRNDSITIFKDVTNSIDLEIHTNRRVKNINLSNLKEINLVD